MKLFTLFFFLLAGSLSCYPQESQKADSTSWEFSADINLYFIPDNFIVLPVMKADHGKVHLEARYNYEDLKTLSAWAGYNFSGGQKIEYLITPMVGAVVGNSNGVAPGVEFSFIKNKIELYSETEYLFDPGMKENNFLYTWTDLTYSIKDWLWAGLSVQRTRLYKTELDIQRGLIVGAGGKRWEISSYLYNVGFSTPLVLVTLTHNF